MSTEKVAVLLSAYNGHAYLRCQLDSILRQRGAPPLTVFIRDDGSDDDTAAIAASYRDDRIVLFRGENRGASRSFLELIAFARTLPPSYRYVAFADQDDRWFPDKLSAALAMLGREDASQPLLYGSASLHTDASLRPLEANVPRRLRRPLTLYNTLIQCVVPGHTMVCNRALLACLPECLDPDGVYCYDGFLLNVANICGRLLYDPRRHAAYRQHAANVYGSRKNPFIWLRQRWRRVAGGDSRRYGRQIAYLFALYGDRMDSGVRDETARFLSGGRSFGARCRYVCRSRLYRQKRWQTALFRLLYLFGGYHSEGGGELWIRNQR